MGRLYSYIPYVSHKTSTKCRQRYNRPMDPSWVFEVGKNTSFVLTKTLVWELIFVGKEERKSV